MPKLHCHYCQSLKGLLIMRSGLSICPRCLWNYPFDDFPLPKVILNQFVFHPVIDPTGTLEYIGAQLMANFLVNGMTVSAVARQMGITRSTVYRRLHKYNLIKPDDDDKVRLNPTLSDLNKANAFDHKMNIVKTKPFCKNYENSVTANSADSPRDLSRAALAAEPVSNAGKD